LAIDSFQRGEKFAMRRIFSSLVIAIVSVMPTKAEVLDYVQLSAGLTVEPDLGFNGVDYEMEKGINIDGQIGWNVYPQVRAGLDMMYTQTDYVGYPTSLSTFSIMAAGTYYFDLGDGRFHPYAGAGVGAVQVNYTAPSGIGYDEDTGSAWAFGFELMAGAAIPTRFNFDLTFGYKYQWADDVTISGIPGIEYQSHNLSAGFLFKL
jgi:opacity protein-like surface antigen